ncbi:SsrA-binding protein SmpB [Candidatus Wolfebacteria bacterium]|nr:SsrA-binding protein SmpB [Candidatus Wolfebacteria bacterium]
MDYARNKRALFDYIILETYEAGIVLRGFEVKAVKSSRVNLAGSYVLIRDNEAWLLNADIPPYQPMNTPDDYDSKRTRRLLLKKSEINSLIGRTQEKGLTLIPLKVYSKNRHIKLEIGLGKSRKKGDKRDVLKKRATQREIDRNL